MKKEIRIVKVKEYYRLCWEYLKRSEKYKKLCNEIHNYKQITLKHLESKGQHLRDNKIGNEVIYLEVVNSNGAMIDCLPISCNFGADKDEAVKLLVCIYDSLFGDIYNSNFENWWESPKNLINIFDNDWTKNAIHTYLPNKEMVKKIDRSIECHTAAFGKEPTLQEVREFCEKAYVFWYDSKNNTYRKYQVFEANVDEEEIIYLKIHLFPPCHETFNESERIEILTKQFRESLKTKYKEISKSKEINGLRKPFPITHSIAPQPIRSEELEKYLKVYDCRKQNLTWKGVFKELFPKKHFTEKRRRELLLFQQKAKKIISNIEKGTFPGKY